MADRIPPPRAKSGVFFGDAPEGCTALCVFVRGRRVIRLEIDNEFYSARWKYWLERFHRQHDKKLKVI